MNSRPNCGTAAKASTASAAGNPITSSRSSPPAGGTRGPNPSHQKPAAAPPAAADKAVHPAASLAPDVDEGPARRKIRVVAAIQIAATTADSSQASPNCPRSGTLLTHAFAVDQDQRLVA